VKDPTLQTYLNEIGRHPLLKRAEEVRLGRLIQGGSKEEADAAAAVMVQSNLRLVVALAKKEAWRFPESPLLDLIQNGNIGLVRAVWKFDPERGFKFSTYGTWWIRQTIQRGGQKDELVRVPAYQKDNQSMMKRAKVELFRKFNRAPTEEELAEYLDWSMRLLRQVQGCPSQSISIDTPIGEEGNTTLGEMLEDVGAPISEDQEVERNRNQFLAEFCREHLTERDILVLTRRYGLDRREGVSLREVGEEIGLTRERVRQIQHKAESRLRRHLRKFDVF
jgi:RNA polymerase nonessential primary-like sigma factor